MLSKSYKEVMRASKNQQTIRALFGETSQGAVTGQRTFTCQQSVLRRNSPLNVSRTILNKQLHYLHSNKVAQSLKPSDDFIPRHLGNDSKSTQSILNTLGVKSIEELMDQTVPASIRLPAD